MRKKWILSLLLAGFITVFAACGNADDAAENNDLQEEATPVAGDSAELPPMPEPDLEGIPDVVAMVNGKEILKEEFKTTYLGYFTQIAMEAQMYGEEVDQEQLKTQIIESMIGQELLIQEAGKAGLEASDEEISQSLDELVAQYGLESQEEFLTAMHEQGLDEEEVRSELAMQVKIDKLIISESGGIEPTEDELKEYYDQILAQIGQMGDEDAEIPTFDEIKSDIKEQVKTQKVSEAAQVIVGKLREESEVTVHL
ncbi:SurA N-terminal domain-containing protein [Alkalihalobacterium alkalinitrilicum]|uniref:SurA N-terminal domain-containing protein n=1 Tax=Alkalihalobacterium alkalinitrilicum TaxID=427920 RepID=UPI0009955E8E|nr:SurA N-terminal domain-containing protein [Alkalihalobacterium alkalinitrilicum]